MLPPDDWLCNKIEKLNLEVTEGHPSRLHESGGFDLLCPPPSEGFFHRPASVTLGSRSFQEKYLCYLYQIACMELLWVKIAL